MVSIFKSFEQMLDSFKFNLEVFSTKPEDLFKDVEYEKTEESGTDENSTWKVEKWSSAAGNVSFYKKVTKYKPKEQKTPTVEELKAQLQEAIKEEKFEKAIKLRDEINKMKKGE